MTYTEATEILAKNTTKNGNYKKQAVLDLVKTLTATKPCPNCNGKGETHSPCAFGGRGDWDKCHVCDGEGRI